MAATVGTKLKILFNQYDLSTYFNSFDAQRTINEIKTTTYGASSEAHVVGLRAAKVSLGGIWDGGSTAVDYVLTSVFGPAGVADVNAQFAPAGFALGNRVSAMACTTNSYKVNEPVTGVATILAELSADDGLDSGVSLHDLVAETATGSNTSVDNGVSTNNGGAAYLNCTAFSGLTSDTRKVQHSADNVTWVDLATFTALTAVGSQRIVLTTAGTAASGTVTLGGAFSAGSAITVTVNGNAVTYTTVSGDTNLNGAATSLAAALNANGTFSASYQAVASGAVVTITAKQSGTAGNVTLSTSVTGGTVTSTASGANLTGGSATGPVNRYLRENRTMVGTGSSTCVVSFCRR